MGQAQPLNSVGWPLNVWQDGFWGWRSVSERAMRPDGIIVMRHRSISTLASFSVEKISVFRI